MNQTSYRILLLYPNEKNTAKEMVNKFDLDTKISPFEYADELAYQTIYLIVYALYCILRRTTLQEHT